MCNNGEIVQVDFSFFTRGERKCKDNEKKAGIKAGARVGTILISIHIARIPVVSPQSGSAINQT